MNSDADTNPNPGDTNESDAATASAAERIAAEATDVRERVRKLVTDAASGQSAALGDVRRAADAVLAGVARGVQSVGQGGREGVLNEAISGVADGVSRSVNATRLALREAEGRGQRFAEEDVKRTVEDLRTIEQLFQDTITRFVDRVTEETKAGADDVRTHAVRTAEGARADIASAIEAATEHPGKLAGDAVNVAADVARRGVSSIFGAAAGLLDTASSAASPRKHDDKA